MTSDLSAPGSISLSQALDRVPLSGATPRRSAALARRLHRWRRDVRVGSASTNGSLLVRGATAVEKGAGYGRTIVVVNDSPELLELAEMLLGDEDYDVKVALMGRGALELIRTTLPDLVILDVRLPDISGWDILQALKLDPKTISIPVLVCSAAVQELRSLDEQLARMGVDVLIKPFAIDTLLDKVRTLIGADT